MRHSLSHFPKNIVEKNTIIATPPICVHQRVKGWGSQGVKGQAYRVPGGQWVGLHVQYTYICPDLFFCWPKIITDQASRHAFTRKLHSSRFLVKAWGEAWAVMSHNIPCHLTTFNQSSVEPGYRRTRVCKFLIMCRVLIKCLGCMVPGGKGWLCFVSVVVKSFVVLIMDISLYLFADIAS